MLVCLLMLTLAAVAAHPLAPAPAPVTTFIVDPTQVHPPTPLVMLTTFDPWNMVMGSDSPRVVVYDSGLVIYVRQNADGDYEYASVVLTKTNLDALMDDFAIGRAFDQLDDYYETVFKTDQPTSTIQVMTDAGDTPKIVTVYGDLGDDPEARNLAPAAFLDLYDKLVAYEHPKATTWRPPKYEIIVWEWDTSGGVDWADDFPGLDDPTTIQRDSVTSLYLSSEQYHRFLKLVENGDPLRIEGRTWAYSVRYPFPHEGVY